MIQPQYSRIYDTIVADHLAHERQMIFLSGPRQVGKTTVCTTVATDYFNWDNDDDRDVILNGQRATAERARVMVAEPTHILAFDEIHRYPRWKLFLKGFFDVYGSRAKILVTGSARLDVFKRGGDSLMGRYFPYRMHPFSVAELVDTTLPRSPVREPRELDEGKWQALYRFGGFPEPFVRRNAAFSTKWHRLRFEQLIREDVRDLSRIVELDQMAALARILKTRSGDQLVYDSLCRDVRVSEVTVKNWVSTLTALHYGFLVRPYYHNIAEAIRKTPKWYMRDWSDIEDVGKRNETLVACHLLKAVEGWTDLGLGEFDLFYLRDKRKREVDFVVTRDDVPWFVVEVKSSREAILPNLEWAMGATGAKHGFQVVMDMPYRPIDVFAQPCPISVSARTFLSQLL